MGNSSSSSKSASKYYSSDNNYFAIISIISIIIYYYHNLVDNNINNISNIKYCDCISQNNNKKILAVYYNNYIGLINIVIEDMQVV